MHHFKVRKQASTKAILGNDYVDLVDKVPVVPSPPSNISEYSEERLRLALQFADETLRHKSRKISPTAQHCFDIYKSTIKAVLEQEYVDNDEKLLLLSNIYMYETAICANTFLRGDKFINPDLVARLAEIRRYELAARYGDYLAHLCSVLELTVRSEVIKDWEQLTARYWADIRHEICGEKDNWRRYELYDRNVSEGDVAITLAVFQACNHMGINFTDTLKTIELYADRNSLVHKPVLHLVGQNSWWVLRKTLARDLNDLPLVIPANLRLYIPLLQIIIESITDIYFDRSEPRPADYHVWLPKDMVSTLSEKMNESREISVIALHAERERVEKVVANCCKRLFHEHSVINLTAPILRHERQKKVWDSLLRL